MADETFIKVFEGKNIRVAWNEEEEKYYFSIVDVVQVLTDSADYQAARKYWSVVKVRMKKEGNESTTNCSQLKLPAADGKKYLTDEWQRAGVHEPRDFAILTNVLTKAWSGKTVGEYKKYKGLTKENLRDNMTSIELALNSLAEAATTELSRQRNPKGMNESRKTAQEGGEVAKNARNELEKKLGRSVVSSVRASDYIHPIEDTTAQELPIDTHDE